MNEPIPEGVRRFITQYIDSVELLEVLLLLNKFPERSFDVEQIKHELRSSQSAIQKRLDDLYSRKILVEAAKPYRYQPRTAEIAATIDELAKQYQTYSNRIIELIFSRQSEVLRNFADAFRIKKDD